VGLLGVGLGLALWAAEHGRVGGTMNDWLIRRLPEPGPPVSGPYWALLVDYVYLALAVGGAVVIAHLLAREGPGARVSSESGSWRVRVERALGMNPEGRWARVGAMFLSTAVAGVTIFFLAGPVLDQVLRGQVYFAVIAGFMLGAYVVRWVLKVDDARCLWPGPLMLGVLGLVVAGLRPGLMIPADYHHTNVVPAWPLVRALPVELVGAGLVGSLWLLRHGHEEHKSA
jgi:hypothetical protein